MRQLSIGGVKKANTRVVRSLPARLGDLQEPQCIAAGDHFLFGRAQPGMCERIAQPLRHRALDRDRPVGAHDHVVRPQQVDRSADHRWMDTHRVNIDVPTG